MPRASADHATGFIYLQIETEFDSEVGRFVAGSRDLDVWSSGDTDRQAIDRAQEAILLFLNEATEMGTVWEILKKAGISVHPGAHPKPSLGTLLRHLKGIPHPVVFAVPSEQKRAPC